MPVMPRTTRPACIDKLVMQHLLDVLDELLVAVRNIQRLHIGGRFSNAVAIAIADRAGNIALEQREDFWGDVCHQRGIWCPANAN